MLTMYCDESINDMFENNKYTFIKLRITFTMLEYITTVMGNAVVFAVFCGFFADGLGLQITNGGPSAKFFPTN